MDDPSDTSWNANGAVVTFQPESYHNGGFLVTGRTGTFFADFRLFEFRVKRLGGESNKTFRPKMSLAW